MTTTLTQQYPVTVTLRTARVNNQRHWHTTHTLLTSLYYYVPNHMVSIIVNIVKPRYLWRSASKSSCRWPVTPVTTAPASLPMIFLTDLRTAVCWREMWLVLSVLQLHVHANLSPHCTGGSHRRRRWSPDCHISAGVRRYSSMSSRAHGF